MMFIAWVIAVLMTFIYQPKKKKWKI
jgi:hypothetical protein